MCPGIFVEMPAMTAMAKPESGPPRALPPDKVNSGPSSGHESDHEPWAGTRTESTGPGFDRVERSDRRMVILIDNRTFIRDCLAQAMRSWAYDVGTLPSVEGCADLVSTCGCDLIILWGDSHLNILADLTILRGACRFCPVLVICDTAGADAAIKVFQLGARGILPTSSNLRILDGVISLILSGGAYVPPDSVIMAERTDSNLPAPPAASVPFTPRQAAIIAAIRKGSPNKIIAYNLGMCESTVKVHIRSIMKKLKVRNRTELALMSFDLHIRS